MKLLPSGTGMYLVCLFGMVLSRNIKWFYLRNIKWFIYEITNGFKYQMILSTKYQMVYLRDTKWF